MTRTGRCLCGAIRFEFDAEPMASVSCHCRDCQYVSGGHPAVVIAVQASSLKAVGETREFRLKADSGAEVYRTFCPSCGTPLFARNERSPDVVGIKLGALDDPSEFQPKAHIWTSSAQPWHHLDPDATHVAKQ
jgi:hypothetical protein